MKIEKRILPSQIQQREKTREVQKVLQTLCDREDDESSEKSFVPARFIPQKVHIKNRRTDHDTSSVQQKILKVDLETDSSSENSESVSSKRDKRSRSEKDKKMKSTRDSNDRFPQKVSRSFVQEKISKRYNISSESNDSTDSETIAETRTTKRNVKSEKITKRKTNCMYLSDSESDENDTRRTSSISKRISKDTRQQDKKVDNFYKAKRDKTKKYRDSTSESEDEEHKRRNTGKRSETSRTSHNSNDERDKLSMKSQPSNIQKDDSDDSTSKEFKKIKLQNIDRNKYSTRHLVDLEIEPTESSNVKNSASDKSEKNITEQSEQNLNDIKKILRDCKKICSSFQMYIETVENLYNKEDKENLILKSIHKIDKLKTVLEEKQKDLTTSYRLWSRNRKKSATKKLHKAVSDDESSKECEKRTMDKDKHISGDKQECKKNKTQLTDENTNINDKQASLNTDDICNDEIEDSPLRDSCKKSTLENDGVNQSNKKNIINESTDMFDTSFEDTEKNRSEVEIETNYDKGELTSEDKFSDPCKGSLQDKIPSEKKKAFLLSCDVREEKNSSNQDYQKKIASVISEETHDDLKESRKTSTDESLDDAEALAKKALLATDSDTSDTLPDANVAKLTEDLITNDTNQTEKNNKMEDNDSDVNSVSTVMLSTFIDQANTNAEKDTTIEAETKVEKKSSDQLDKRACQEMTSSDEAEKAAKKALLESSSDDSTLLSSESGKLAAKKSESDSSEKNIRAKLSLLASSSESSNSEPTLSKTTNTSKSIKHESESNEDSIIARLKKKRLNKNRYNNDKKLKMSCKVHLTRLDAKVLKCYSRALRKSREYLEHKAFKSLVNLDKLEKRRTKNTKKDSLTDDDSSSKILTSASGKKKTKTKEESLMDYLKEIENGNISSTVETSDTEESVPQISKVDDMAMSNEALISEADRIAKENLLNSSDSNEKETVMDSDNSINSDDKNKIEENKKKKKKTEDKTEAKTEDKTEDKIEDKTDQETSKEDDSKTDKSDWRRDKILTMKFSDTDSETEKKKWEKKQEKIANKSKENNSDSDNEERSFKSKKKKKIRRRILDSDSDVKITDLDSDSSSSVKQILSDSESKEKEKLKRKKHKHGDNSSDTDSSLAEKKPKPKRKRIKKMASDSDSSVEEIKNSQGSAHGKSGRKNIRKVLKDKQVAEDTKLAAKEEEERIKRIADRQALYNEMYEMRLAGEEKVDKLVLDFDTETKEELVTVHEDLVKRLKPHQAQGIKFMWDACFESIERVKNTSGSGCIIAHCMGLGKTLQVITLTHTLLTHEATNIKTVLVVCPLSTVLNWLNEYNTWLKDFDDDIEVYELTKYRKNFERKRQLQRWQETGGVMIIGYAMFRNLTGPNRNIRKGMKEAILECLVNPGADLIVCDEGHLLKNEDTALSKCIRRVKTLRRIVLTGTPLQNNLIEYHCMVQFVKPNLLGTRNEFLNRFVNPITNGQFDDSTAYDVKLMKKRAHVLHKMLEGCVQRFDYSVLTPFLPPKQEYVIFVKLTDIQIKMYQYYLQNFVRVSQKGTLFADFQALQRIWTHPVVLRLNAEKIEKANEKKELLSDSEGSLKDFINDDSDTEDSTTSNSSSDSDVQTIDDEKKDGSNVSKRRTRNNPGEEESEEEIKEGNEKTESEWWSQFVQPEHFEDIRVSAKLLLLFGILKECEQIGDKVLVFSQSLYSLTLIEEFLRRIDDQTQNGTPCETIDNHTGSWSLGLDYFRLDGQTSPENRNLWCKIFNRPTNTRARLFLISTRAGGLGINLTAANRVIIFDASWNPSHDVQSIFRIYRFGQKKPCYVYRFLAAGTMEEKIYNRQVTKLSLSCRVVDEQQIERHYSNHNLNELYAFEAYDTDKEKPTLNLPRDRLLAEILLKFKDFVENYHEHDSLLENKAEEELNEEERKQAWLEYEEEKKGKPLINPMANAVYQNNMLLQQYMMNSNMMPQNMSLQFDYENFQQLIRKDYPNATPEQQKMMTNRAIIEMYNYWEKQATLQYNKQPVQPIRNPTVVSNFQQIQPRIPNSNQQISQMNQLLPGQSVNYVNANKPAQPSNAQMRDVVPNIFTYPNTPSANNISGNTDQNNMIPTTSNVGVTHQSGMSGIQVAAQTIDKSKIQEE